MSMLAESSLFPTLRKLGKYNARDLADLLYLYCLTLHLLRSDFISAPYAQTYAKHSVNRDGWQQAHVQSTDLYQFLHVLLSRQPELIARLKNQQASELFLHDLKLSEHVFVTFLDNISHTTFDYDKSANALLTLERALKIQVTNYRSIRRLISSWHTTEIDQEARRLSVTRLIQALDHRANNGDLLPQLKKLAKSQNLLLKNVHNPEKHADPLDKPSLLKQLALSTGLGVGAYLLGKALFSGGNK